jgi:nucleotide-binding universal stress UspA family protein
MAGAQRTIIVGVDYSDPSIRALDEALRLVTGDPLARLVPLLALEGSPSEERTEQPVTGDLVARSRENLVRLVNFRARALGVLPPQVEPCVAFGEAVPCLLNAAREQAADLIVVGTHGRRGLAHLLLGSVAEELVRAAACSVLVARGGVAEQPASNGEPLAELPSGAGRAAPAAAEKDEVVADDEVAADDAVGGGVNREAAMVLSEPYLDAGRVLLRVLDVPTGQLFLCSFDALETVRVEPLEGSWVPAPSSAARVRVARRALAEARSAPELFQPLFAASAREQS